MASHGITKGAPGETRPATANGSSARIREAKRDLLHNAALAYEATVAANAPEAERVQVRAELARAAVEYARAVRSWGARG